MGNGRTRTWRLRHRARPASQHREIEIDGANLLAQEVRAVCNQMCLDHIEKSTRAGLGSSFHDGFGGLVVASEALRVLPDHQFFLERIRQEAEPLIELRPLGRGLSGREARFRMIVHEMQDNCGGFKDCTAIVD